MHGFISDLHWVMPQCTHLLHTMFILHVDSHNWMNTKNLASCEFPNVSIPSFPDGYSSKGQQQQNGNSETAGS